MSAALGLQIADTVAFGLINHHKANKQADIAAKQQSQQAKNDLIVGVTPHVVNLVTACMNARSTALQIQQENQRIELEHDTMLRQAHMNEQDSTNRHTLAMEKLEKSVEMFSQAIRANELESQDLQYSYEQLSLLRKDLIIMITQPGLTTDDKALLKQTLKDIQVEISQLIDAKRLISSQTHSAFIQSCDVYRDGPRTFTDVS